MTQDESVERISREMRMIVVTPDWYDIERMLRKAYDDGYDAGFINGSE